MALISFDLDSVDESLSGLVMILRLRQHGKISVETEESIENRARRLGAATFFILGCYLLYESIEKLVAEIIPEPSLPGIIIAILSIVIMPLLTWQKYNIGKKIKSRALMADTKENLVCAFILVALLIGLGTNFVFGFW